MTNPSAYYDLAVVVLFTGLMWIPYTLASIKHDGLGVAIGNRETLPALPPWAGRAKRAHLNAVENLVLFAPALLGALAVDANAQAVAQATHVYVGARVVHYLAYVAGIHSDAMVIPMSAITAVLIPSVALKRTRLRTTTDVVVPALTRRKSQALSYLANINV